jgi:threonine dehydrogenase-like Zn-dependent dehydrogenase
MKAIGITPGKAHTARLLDLPRPAIGEIPDGRGVLVRVLQVGVDGTDRELYLGKYGAAPEGDDFLITGHESLGQVMEVGARVTDLAPGDYVVPTVRRPGSSVYDQIGNPDMTIDDVYCERGINLLHGFLAEYFVEDTACLVQVPPALRSVAVLTEPMSIVQKGIIQAYEIQRRLRVWRPLRAAVMGTGTIGLLATLALRLRGLDVTVFARTPKPTLNASLVEALGARYLSTREDPIGKASEVLGPFDLIFEATGFSPVVFEAAHVLASNGILVLSSITSGSRTAEIESDRLNLEFVLGNKVMFGTVNANRDHFEAALAAFAQAEICWPGWLSRLLTHSIRGLENYADLFSQLFIATDAVKVYMVVHSEQDHGDL